MLPVGRRARRTNLHSRSRKLRWTRRSAGLAMPMTAKEFTLRCVTATTVLLLGALSVGCTTIVSSVTEDLADGLSDAILNSDDLAGVRDGAPAYLILLDGLIAQDPDNPNLLLAAASLNTAYAGAFVDDPSREILLTDKAFDYALRASCMEIQASCNARTEPFDDFRIWVAALDESDVEVAYRLGSIWALWILAHADDWNAVAELARAKALMSRVVALDEAFADGGAHLYLGAMETFLPAAMGGRPEIGREHFERALAISEGRDLVVKVMYAQLYARLVFDRELHDQLLTDVVTADPRVDGLTMSNLVAQQQAQELLAGADNYFGGP